MELVPHQALHGRQEHQRKKDYHETPGAEFKKRKTDEDEHGGKCPAQEPADSELLHLGLGLGWGRLFLLWRRETRLRLLRRRDSRICFSLGLRHWGFLGSSFHRRSLPFQAHSAFRAEYITRMYLTSTFLAKGHFHYILHNFAIYVFLYLHWCFARFILPKDLRAKCTAADLWRTTNSPNHASSLACSA